VITLHKLNGTEFVLNAELIETLEPRGAETLVCLATGNKFNVTETAEEISRKVVEYRRKLHADAAAAGKTVSPIKGFERQEP
jgi:flagellar protein FlbD